LKEMAAGLILIASELNSTAKSADLPPASRDYCAAPIQDLHKFLYQNMPACPLAVKGMISLRQRLRPDMTASFGFPALGGRG
jgi:hypothetical protein